MKLHDRIIERLREQANRSAQLFINEPTQQYFDGHMSASIDALRLAASIKKHFGESGEGKDAGENL